MKGKVVLALRSSPGESGPCDGERASAWSDPWFKALEAQRRGAAALLFVCPATTPDEPDEPAPQTPHVPTLRVGLPVVQVSRAVADRLLAAMGTTVAAVHDHDRPRSAPLPGVRVSGRATLTPVEAATHNVVGVFPGVGALKDEVVVVGAHYDHLGFGGAGSKRPHVREAHHGADDNASGTAAMVCAVEAFAKAAPEGDRRTLVAVAFSGEEMGLVGSDAYTTAPIFPMDHTVAMVNLDMVGRLRSGALTVRGTGSGDGWLPLLRPLGARHGLMLLMSADDGLSDHASFYSEGVPAVHLFTGDHEEYHTPDDRPETLNIAGGGRITELAVDLLRTLVSQPERILFQRSSLGPMTADDRRRWPAWLGAVPHARDLWAGEGGVLLSHVRPSGPAERGGLRGGDTIVAVAGVEVRNVYEMPFVLHDHQPGDTVDVMVLRDGECVLLPVTLGERGGAGGSR